MEFSEANKNIFDYINKNMQYYIVEEKCIIAYVKLMDGYIITASPWGIACKKL